MIGDKAIRVGQPLLDESRHREQLCCDECRATFWITHEHRTADLTRARKQIPIVKSILSDEHVDSKFTDHLKSYDLDD
jgi:hypothetical protein